MHHIANHIKKQNDVSTDSLVGSTLTWCGCTSGVPSSSPGSQAFPNPVPPSLSPTCFLSKSTLSYQKKAKMPKKLNDNAF